MSTSFSVIDRVIGRTEDERDDLREKLNKSRLRVMELEDELKAERNKGAQVSMGAQMLRDSLSPLYKGLKAIFGELEGMDLGTAPVETNSRVSAIWSDWKQKFPGHPAKAIDALLLHGSMTQGQLRIAVGCATGTISNVVSTLNRAGLINKSGGKISLKEL